VSDARRRAARGYPQRRFDAWIEVKRSDEGATVGDNYLMCDSFWILHGHQAVEVERRAPLLEVEENPDGVGKYLTDEAMLEVPQIMHTDAGDREAFGQMGTYGLDTLADAGTGAQQAARMGRGHAFARGRDDQHGRAVGQQGVADGVDEALVGGNDAGETGHKVVEQLDVVGASGQERIGNYLGRLRLDRAAG